MQAGGHKSPSRMGKEKRGIQVLAGIDAYHQDSEFEIEEELLEWIMVSDIMMEHELVPLCIEIPGPDEIS